MSTKRRQAKIAIQQGRERDVGRLSADLEKLYGVGDLDATWGPSGDYPKPDKDKLSRTVKQYTPVFSISMMEFTNDLFVLHGFGQPLEED